MGSTLYERHNYLNKDVDFLISNEIIEYDMQSAGYSIIKQFKLLTEDQIARLDGLGKKDRQIQIGLYQRQDKELGRTLNEGFVKARQLFFEANELTDADILSIKKDAIYTTKRCFETSFGLIQFAEKNVYTSYYHLNNYEFYYNAHQLDVKGISDELLKLHEEYMLDFLFNFFKMNEIAQRKKVIDLLTDFSRYYRNKQLAVGYYRELNNQSLFKIDRKMFDEKLGVRSAGHLDGVDIQYNYMNYFVPLISILV